MIDKLSLNNFQSHKLSVLEFAPGVNAIVGVSDSGKSAILRALRWVAYGRPSGEAYKSHGKDRVTVGISVKGSEIIRKRAKAVNKYQLDTEIFSAAGTSVPEPIEKLLGFSDINVQGQMDAPFLLSATPGEVARYLNGILGLDKIDESLSAIRSLSTSVTAETRRLTGEYEEQTAALLNFDYIEDAEALLKEIESGANEVDLVRVERAALQETVDILNTIVVPEIPDAAGDISDIDELIFARELAENSRDDIKKKVAELLTADGGVGRLSLQLTALEKELAAAAPEICPTCGQEIK